MAQAVDEVFNRNQTFYTDDLSDTAIAFRIRTLRIEPGSYTDPVVCNLDTQSLSTGSGYWALSCSWGTTADPVSITINGQPGFTVTQNALAALRRVRDPSDTVTLWVDAIYIDQTNVLERNSQVAAMGDIYRHAELVIFWLGPCGATVLGQVEGRECGTHTLQDTNGLLSVRCDDVPLLRDDVGAKSSWWWRVWTLQEIVLAETAIVLLGPHRYGFDDFAAALYEHKWNYSRIQGENVDAAARALDDIRMLRRQYNSNVLSRRRSNLEDLLLAISRRQCRDLRDKMFAVLGMVQQDDTTLRLLPDYRIPLKDVYLSATLHILQSARSLNPLLHTWAKLRHPSPSWVCDFSQAEGSIDHVYIEDHKVHDTLRASASMEAAFFWSERQLFTKGIYVDAVKDTGKYSAFVRARKPDAWPRNFRDLDMDEDDFVRRLEEATVSATQRECTEAAKCVGLLRPDQAFARAMTEDGWFTSKKISLAEIGQHSTAFNEYRATERYERDVVLGCHGRTMFVTAHGLVGIAYPDINSGDLICVLFGADLPVLLRPANAQNTEFWFIGPAFVPGIQYGELVDRYRQGSCDDISICIV